MLGAPHQPAQAICELIDSEAENGFYFLVCFV